MSDERARRATSAGSLGSGLGLSLSVRGSELAMERPSIDTEHARRQRFVARDALQHASDVLHLELPQREERARFFGRVPWLGVAHAVGQILETDGVSSTERHCTLDTVL
jgi:hypothetical protein